MKKTFLIIFCFLFMCNTLLADDKNDAKMMIKNKIDSAISVLQNKDLKKEVKNEKIIEIVSPVFNFGLIAKLSMGKINWQKLSPDNKKRFVDLFENRMKSSYLEKLNMYTNESINYGEPVQKGRKVQVPTELISKDNKINMIYKLYKSKGMWKIYDLEVEGVSVVKTYKTQFDEVLKKGTVEDLMKELGKPESE